MSLLLVRLKSCTICHSRSFVSIHTFTSFFFSLLLKLPSCGNFIFGVSFFACTRWAWNFQWFFGGGEGLVFSSQKKTSWGITPKSPISEYWGWQTLPPHFLVFFFISLFFKSLSKWSNKKVVVEFQEHIYWWLPSLEDDDFSKKAPKLQNFIEKKQCLTKVSGSLNRW